MNLGGANYVKNLLNWAEEGEQTHFKEEHLMTPEENLLINSLHGQGLGYGNENRKYCCRKDRFGGAQ